MQALKRGDFVIPVTTHQRPLFTWETPPEELGHEVIWVDGCYVQLFYTEQYIRYTQRYLVDAPELLENDEILLHPAASPEYRTKYLPDILVRRCLLGKNTAV